jgi:hydroxymethylpyrimidine/phosphomethylpyrimidine kinase
LNERTQGVNGPGSAIKRRTVVLSAAGFDPSSGAGVTADVKVFAHHGLYGVLAITALTVQSTQGVRQVVPVGVKIFRHTLECLMGDVPIAGVKIGMLGSAEIALELVCFLKHAAVPRENIVLDPVLVSSSGAALLDNDGLQLMRKELLGLVGWVTPNMDELAALTGEPSTGPQQVPALAAKLAGLSAGLNVVVTGGHLDPPDDFLRTASGEEVWIPGQRVETTSTHGTGCVFSSALLCRVLAGDAPADAVRGAKAFVIQALQTAAPIGRGKGPVLM